MLNKKENKRKVGYMLHPKTIIQLDKLKEVTNYSKAVLIEMAVNKLYLEQFK
jgi:hypothetical protein